MNWTDAKAGVESGTQTAYQSEGWPNPIEGLVLYQNAIWLAGETYISEFTPTEEQENATNWVLAPYNGDLPPR
jgi:hypothetical protein